MRALGITYDTGLIHRGLDTNGVFSSAAARRDLHVIRDELHCTAVRVTGSEPDRLETAARHAAALGLEVWCSPFTIDLPADALLDLLADCAERAERLRLTGAEVVLTTGAELALFTPGFLPGDTVDERLGLLGDPARARTLLSAVPALVNDFLARAVRVVRARFGGRVSYAAIPFEGVDWAPFDLVGVDAYRSKEVAPIFADAMRSLAAQDKPVAITELGCATFRGAADAGARGGMIVRYDDAGRPAGLDGAYERAEDEQAAHLRELLDVFAAAGVDTTFVCTFASHFLPHRDAPHDDLDLASYGVVKVRGDGSWEPKAAFSALADWHRSHPVTR